MNTEKSLFKESELQKKMKYKNTYLDRIKMIKIVYKENYTIYQKINCKIDYHNLIEVL